MRNFFKIFFFIFLFFAVPALAQTVNLPNPIGPAEITPEVVEGFAGRVVNGFLEITGAIALLMFVYGGFVWLTSRGEPDKIKRGKGIFIWSVIGLVVIFSSYLLVQFIIRGITGTTGPRCCVQETEGKISCREVADDAAAQTCAAGNGVTVSGICNNVAACPAQQPAQ